MMSHRLRQAILEMVTAVELIATRYINLDLMFRAKDLRTKLRGS